MEGERLTRNRAPREIVRRFGKIGAFVEVGSHFLSLVDREIGEETFDKRVGNSVEYFPSVSCFRYLKCEDILDRVLGNKSYKVLNVTSKAKIGTTVEVKLNIEISYIILHR